MIIPLNPVPKQSVTVPLDDIVFNIAVKSTENNTIVDITADDEVIIQGARVIDNTFIIPYKYLEKGNFFFTVEKGEKATYPRFGVDQFLVYATESELNG